jgi:hypothetical protein
MQTGIVGGTATARSTSQSSATVASTTSTTSTTSASYETISVTNILALLFRSSAQGTYNPRCAGSWTCTRGARLARVHLYHQTIVFADAAIKRVGIVARG